MFDQLRRKIGVNIGVAADRLTTVLLLPVKTANYLAWKEAAVCRKAGFEPSAVESVVGRFVRGEGEVWNLYVESLALKDCRTVACTADHNRAR